MDWAALFLMGVRLYQASRVENEATRLLRREDSPVNIERLLDLFEEDPAAFFKIPMMQRKAGELVVFGTPENFETAVIVSAVPVIRML
jgi:hypothetical protein